MRQALDPSYHAFFQFTYFSPIVYVLINAPRLGVHYVHEAEILAHGDVQEDIVDAAKTIILCAQHQKRIGMVTLTKLLALILAFADIFSG